VSGREVVVPVACPDGDRVTPSTAAKNVGVDYYCSALPTREGLYGDLSVGCCR